MTLNSNCNHRLNTMTQLYNNINLKQSIKAKRRKEVLDCSHIKAAIINPNKTSSFRHQKIRHIQYNNNTEIDNTQSTAESKRINERPINQTHTNQLDHDGNGGYWKKIQLNNNGLIMKRIKMKLKEKRDKSVEILKNLSFGVQRKIKKKNSNEGEQIDKGKGKMSIEGNEKQNDNEEGRNNSTSGNGNGNGNKEQSSLLNMNTNEISFTYSDDTDTKRVMNLNIIREQHDDDEKNSKQSRNVLEFNNNPNARNDNIEDFNTFYKNLHKKLFGT